MDPFEPQEYDPSIIDSDLYENRADSGRATRKTTTNTTAGSKSRITQGGSSSEQSKRKKNEKKNEGEPGFWAKLVNFFCDRRLHGTLGVGLILFACYVLVASISFFSTGLDDQSVITGHTMEQLTGNKDIVNPGGPSGAVIAQVIITNSLGVGAIVMIAYLIIIGLAMLRLIKIKFWSMTFKALLITVMLSMVAGLVSYSTDSYILWGGQHGRIINMMLIDRFGWIGAVAVSIFLVASVAFVYLDEIIRLYNAYRRKVEARRAKLEAEREAKAELDRKVKEGVTDEIISNEPEEEPGEQYEGPFEPETVEFEHQEELLRPSDDEEQNEEIGIINAGKEDGMNEVESAEQGDDVEITVKVSEIEQADGESFKAYDPTADLFNYKFPSVSLLKEYEYKTSSVDIEQQDELKKRITKTLEDYKVKISKIEATVGATITLYEIIPVEGTRIQTIKNLGDDLMLSLSAKGIRIIAPIPGKGTIGIEVPNQEPQTVSIRSILGSKEFQESTYELPMAMGTTISNKVYVADLAKMPHLLVAGATGQGKSVGLNTIIASLLYKKHPATLKFVLIDPKMVEFSLYSRIEKHYLAKLEEEEEAIITSPDKVSNTLNSLCVEMDQRYALLKDAGCRQILEYNKKFIERSLNPDKGHRYLPYIVIIVDEFADLIQTAGKEIENAIGRIAQKARAVGMHMIIATQRPSTNVVTGIIKANFPGRMAFKTSSSIDSKTILDRPGANQLIGRGDMLILSNGVIERVQCAFIDTPEVDEICRHIESQSGYSHAYYLPEYVPEGGNAGNSDISDIDPLFAECARFIVLTSTASTSSLQRRYSIGYNRAGKIIDQMEAAGIVGHANGSKPRDVLMDSISLELLLERMNIQ